MELADPVSIEDRGATAAIRNPEKPEKPQKPPAKTATLDKEVIDRKAQYYIRNGLD